MHQQNLYVQQPIGLILVLAKKYISIEELDDDNGKSAYFDSTLDITRYELLDSYEIDQASMEPDAFSNYFIEELINYLSLML